MHRTTVSLPDELLHRLRLMAAEQHTSMAALVREALGEKARSYRPQPRSLGIGALRHKDTGLRTAEAGMEPLSWR